MKQIFFYFMILMPMFFIVGNVHAQQSQPLTIPDYGASIQFQPKALQKLDAKKVEANLRKEFQHLYGGFVKTSNTFVFRITAVMAGSQEMRDKLNKLYPNQTVKQITSKDYELFEKQFE